MLTIAEWPHNFIVMLHKLMSAAFVSADSMLVTIVAESKLRRALNRPFAVEAESEGHEREKGSCLAFDVCYYSSDVVHTEHLLQ